MEKFTKAQRKAKAISSQNKIHREQSKMAHSFPNCIGKFPECVSYNSEMILEDRPECRLCPYK